MFYSSKEVAVWKKIIISNFHTYLVNIYTSSILLEIIFNENFSLYLVHDLNVFVNKYHKSHHSQLRFTIF